MQTTLPPIAQTHASTDCASGHTAGQSAGREPLPRSNAALDVNRQGLRIVSATERETICDFTSTFPGATSHISTSEPGSRSRNLPVRHLGRLGGHGRHQRCLAMRCGLQRCKHSGGGSLSMRPWKHTTSTSLSKPPRKSGVRSIVWLSRSDKQVARSARALQEEK